MNESKPDPHIMNESRPTPAWEMTDFWRDVLEREEIPRDVLRHVITNISEGRAPCISATGVDYLVLDWSYRQGLMSFAEFS
jgi:hypothetical protein